MVRAVRVAVIGATVAAACASDAGNGQDWDWRRTPQGNLVSPVRNYEGLPGKDCSAAGWVFAATAMIADRIAIMQPDQPKVQLSNQVILNCAEGDGCSDHTSIGHALELIKSIGGVPDRTCMGWRGQKETCSDDTMCLNCLPGKCEPRPVYLRFNITDFAQVSIEDSTLRQEIRENGPIACELSDRSYATLVGFSGDSFVGKFERGTFFGHGGFRDVAIDELKECWWASPTAPWRFQRTTATGRLSTIFFFGPATSLRGERVRFEGHRGPVPQGGRVLEATAAEAEEQPLPEEVNWMTNEEGLSLLTPVQSHHNGPGYCGACWSMASSSTFSDRLKIRRGGPHATDVFISPQTTVDCVRGAHSTGCGGGDANDVFPFFVQNGTVDETCNVWASGEQACTAENRCKDCPKGKCHSVKPFESFRAKDWGNIKGEKAMMRELARGGPIDCGIATPPELDEFFFGDRILCDHDTPPEKWEISHDVEVVGYGTDASGAKYWLVRNSWSTAFGDNGFFKVCRGNNNMLLEEACSWVEPEVIELQ